MATETRKFNAVHTERPAITVSHWHLNNKYSNKLMHIMKPFKKVPQAINEQEKYPVLLNFRDQLLGTPFDAQRDTLTFAKTRISSQSKTISCADNTTTTSLNIAIYKCYNQFKRKTHY